MRPNDGRRIEDMPINAKNLPTITLIALLTSLAPSIGLPHHSYAMFDRTRTATVSGTVRTFQWTNPHVYLWLNVTDASGAPQVYAFEFGGGPNGLARSGWTTQTLAAGDHVSVTYNPLKDGRTGGGFISVVLPSGATMDSNGVVPDGGRATGVP